MLLQHNAAVVEEFFVNMVIFAQSFPKRPVRLISFLLVFTVFFLEVNDDQLCLITAYVFCIYFIIFYITFCREMARFRVT